MGADEVMSAGSPAPCGLPRAALYLPDPVARSRDPRSATSGRPGSVSGAYLAVRCLAGFMAKTVIPKLSVLAGHFVRPSRATPARFDLRLGLLQAGCLQDADYA